MTQKPSIGRIVHVYGDKLSSMGDTLNGPEAAMIVGLHEEEGVVDLVVFQSNGIFHKNRVSYSETPRSYRWTWPPKV